MSKEYYARWKQSFSKPIHESSVKLHISEMDKPILCGIDKRHPDIYEYGFEPLETIHHGFNVCRNCVNIYNKLKQKDNG